MSNFKRHFGSGFKGLIISLILFFIARHYLIKLFHIPDIAENSFTLRLIIFIILTLITAGIIIWSIVSLNPKLRGITLMTKGVFKYFRHPLYAAFLTFFNFGLAILLNNWIYIAWAVILHPVWHLLIRSEEKALRDAFPGEYEEYCRKTGRFIPKVFRFNK